jgi:TonB family protein
MVSHTDPEYSEEARMARLTGTFTVSFIVGEDGKGRDVRAAASPGLGLGEKAIEAVSSWRFQPGLKDGTPIAVAMNAEMNFRLLLEGRGEWVLSRALFAIPEGTTRPVLTAAPYPPAYATTGPNGSVTISFDVDPKGMTSNLHIERSSNPALESEVISIVRGWRFQPGVKDGEPVSVRCTMEFVKGNGNTPP